MDYLDNLRTQVAGYMGTWRELVLLAPAYGALMFHLLGDPRLNREHRLWVDAAIAYLVSPNDVIPEDEVGPYGYLDDVFCCAFVTSRIADDLGWDVMEEGWGGVSSAHDTSQQLLAREHELLGHDGDDVLRFAGLYEPADLPEPRLRAARG